MVELLILVFGLADVLIAVLHFRFVIWVCCLLLSSSFMLLLILLLAACFCFIGCSMLFGVLLCVGCFACVIFRGCGLDSVLVWFCFYHWLVTVDCCLVLMFALRFAV